MGAFVSRKIARTTFVTLPIFPLNYGVSKLVPEGNEIKQIISFVVPCFKKKVKHQHTHFTSRTNTSFKNKNAKRNHQIG